MQLHIQSDIRQCFSANILVLKSCGGNNFHLFNTNCLAYSPTSF